MGDSDERFLRSTTPRAGGRHSPLLVDRYYTRLGFWMVESGVRVSPGSGRYIRLGNMQAIAIFCTTPLSTFMRGSRSVLLRTWVPDLSFPYLVRTVVFSNLIFLRRLDIDQWRR